jgi:hypothetical protein
MNTTRVQSQWWFPQFLLSVLCATLLASCGVVNIQTPARDSHVNSPVAVNLNWTADMQAGTNVEVTLDGADISNLFQVTGNRTASASIVMTPGLHTLVAGGNIYCWYCSGGSYSHTSTTASFTVDVSPGPSISLSPNPLNVDAGTSANGTVTLSSPSPGGVSVTLTPQGSGSFKLNNSIAGQPAQVTLGANQASAAFSVTGVTAGSGTVQATATGFSPATSTVNVKPVIVSLSPTSGAPGSSVTVNGRGFVPGASVRFGQTAATTTFMSATVLNAAVPSNLNGTQNVTVLAGGQTSNQVAFSIATAGPSPVVFRSSSTDVQSFNFTTPGAASLISTQSATASPGSMVVGLTFNGTLLVRSSSGNVQTFNVNGAGQITAASAVTATLSPVGAAVAASSNLVVRASATDIQVFSLTGTTPALQGTMSAASSSTGTGVDFAVVSGQSLAVRGYSGGVETFNITTPTAITLRGNNTGGGLSSTGVGIRVIGTLALRAYSNGLEVYDLTPTTPNRIASNVTGGLSGTGVAVTSDVQLARIVRATNSGIEVYQLSGTTLTKLGSMNGTLSPTGVAVAMKGTRVFRAHSSGVEEYDISAPSNITLAGNTPATLSSTGVGIAVR